MKQWEVYVLDLPTFGPHPVVVISGNAVCSNNSIKTVNALLVSSVRAGDTVSAFEVGLDTAEGLSHLSACQCHSFLTIAKQRFDGLTPKGEVGHHRKTQLKRKIKDSFDLH